VPQTIFTFLKPFQKLTWNQLSWHCKTWKTGRTGWGTTTLGITIWTHHLREKSHLTYISFPHPPCKDHQKLTQESKWFNVNDYMFGIIWNVSVRLVQMSHFQISKAKGNKVFKSLEISDTQRMWSLDKWSPTPKRCNLWMQISIVRTCFHVKEVSVYLKKCSKGFRAFYTLDKAESGRVSQLHVFLKCCVRISSIYSRAFDVFIYYLCIDYEIRMIHFPDIILLH